MSASANKREAEQRARTIVDRWAKTALFTGWIPGMSLALAGADMLMIRQVGDAYGIPAFDEEALKAHLGGVLGSATGAVASEALNFVPIVGWVAKSVILNVKADAIGKAVIEYFKQRSTLPE